VEISIRRTRPDEIGIMCELDIAIFGKEDDFDTTDMWKGLETFLVTADGQIVGSVALRHHTNVAEDYEADYLDCVNCLYIVSVGVLPEWQGQGIGKIVMVWLINYGREHGFERISSNARSSNQKSIHFHTRFGFQVIQTIPNWYGNKSSDIMELKL